MYLDTKGSRMDNPVVKGKRACQCFLQMSSNACVAAREVTTSVEVKVANAKQGVEPEKWRSERK